MELFQLEYDRTLPTDPEFNKVLKAYFSCGVENKKCCTKFKKGKRCKKCPAYKKK